MPAINSLLLMSHKINEDYLILLTFPSVHNTSISIITITIAQHIMHMVIVNSFHITVYILENDKVCYTSSKQYNILRLVLDAFGKINRA